MPKNSKIFYFALNSAVKLDRYGIKVIFAHKILFLAETFDSDVHRFCVRTIYLRNLAKYMIPE